MKPPIKIPVLASITFFTLVGAALAQQPDGKQVFACIEQDAQGFHAEGSDAYRATRFLAKKFTMTLEGSRLVAKVNGQEEVYKCSMTFPHRSDLLQCSEELFFLGFNLKSLHFTRAQMYGHLGGNGKDSIIISHGECQRF